MKQPDPSYLLEKADISFPLIGFYDLPDETVFQSLITTRTCLFAYYPQWAKGKSVLLTKEQYGCGGAGSWLCDVRTRSEDDYVWFLADEEGLKADRSLMRSWIRSVKPYEQQFDKIVVGPLNPDAWDYLRTITFFINPDQLSILMIAAQLHSKPGDPEPVLAPFGSGCMQVVALFKDLEIPQAIIGATDMAMRKYLPPEILAFTVTRPLFELLCAIGSGSYLEKRFFKDLKKSRGSLNLVC